VGTGGSRTAAMQFCRGVPLQQDSDAAVTQRGGTVAGQRGGGDAEEEVERWESRNWQNQGAAEWRTCKANNIVDCVHVIQSTNTI
jgi:hypothetical protein